MRTMTRQNKRTNVGVEEQLMTSICTFLSYSLQNNNVKSSTFAWFEEGDPNGQLLEFWNCSTMLTYILIKLRCGAVRDISHFQPFAEF